MNWRWYYNRLQIMSIKEVVCHRIPQFFQLNFNGRLQSIRKPKALYPVPNFKSPPYSLKKIEQLFLESPFSGIYPFFDTEVNILAETAWRKDPKSGKISPLAYYHKINKQDFEKVGDIKYVAELSRFHFLPFLAFKFAQNEDAAPGKRIDEILETWVKQNPYLKSIHWTSGIEVAIRSINLVYTYDILKQFHLLSPVIDGFIRQIISNGYEFLKNHLSGYSSANNHLMAELVGLVVVSSYFQVVHKEKRKWQRLFFDQILQQINKDGIHMELSTRYHAEVSDQILIGISFLKNNGVQIPEEINDRVKHLFEFTNHVTYKGIDTLFGDNDEGFVINPFFDNGFSLYVSQLASSNHCFETSYITYEHIDFRNYLIFGDDFEASSGEELPQDTFFEGSGYCFMYDHQNGIKLAFDTGKIGDALSAAHGHSDLLHFTLQKNRDPLIVDAGTFQYHTKNLFWRNYFRGIAAHNTISINDAHHAKMNNRMSWVDMPKKPFTEIKFEKNKIICKAEHTAFSKYGVVHERTIEMDKELKMINIRDILRKRNSNPAMASFFLHFPSQSNVEHDGKKIILVHGNSKIVLENKDFAKAKLIKGDAKKPFGWFSPSYDKKQPALSLLLEKKVNDCMTIMTSISYE